ncbi:WD40/YVTN/BNR-like repeat-containing protein [Flavobacterium oreochromis]|uniref:IPT/TIG domain-containing protein n=1 Tax=Flavobacterium columnare TaxID=996 RepID=A0A246GE62_9FLAO|nr:hypothetical protein [Flavobacterium oreochromis]OWP79684.1 hypothetical protein BWK62_00135 [Flavobacterium oreochromis]
MRFFLIASVTTTFFLLSCSKEEEKTNNQLNTNILPDIVLNPIKKDFLVEGEELIINGVNFVRKDEKTKLVFKSFLTNQVIEKEVTPVSNTELRFTITNELSLDRNSLSVKIGQKVSNSEPLFIIKRGWNKINAFNQTESILKSYVFEDTNNLIMYVEIALGGNRYDRKIIKTEASYLGYTDINTRLFDYVSDFTMFNSTTGAGCNGDSAYPTNDSFDTFKRNLLLGPASSNPSLPIVIDMNYIYYFTQNKFLFYNVFGVEFLTEDGGRTFTNIPQPYVTRKILFPGTTNPHIDSNIKSNPMITLIGKSISNNKFYKLGRRYTKETPKSPVVKKNLVLESPTGYDNWTIVDTTTVLNNNFNNIPKFLTIDKIFIISDNNLYISSNLQASWSLFKSNVKYFSLRTLNEIYIHQNDAIYKSIDAGQTWNLELNLPANSVVNDISFTKGKVVVSGSNGLLFIKYE